MGVNVFALRLSPITLRDLPREDWDRLPCTKADPELFMPYTPEMLYEAFSYCNDCPFQSACLNDGEDGEESGVWGGRLLRDGAVYLRNVLGWSVEHHNWCEPDSVVADVPQPAVA